MSIFTNKIFAAALIGWIVSQGVKVLTSIIKHKKFDLERVMGIRRNA